MVWRSRATCNPFSGMLTGCPFCILWHTLSGHATLLGRHTSEQGVPVQQCAIFFLTCQCCLLGNLQTCSWLILGSMFEVGLAATFCILITSCFHSAIGDSQALAQAKKRFCAAWHSEWSLGTSGMGRSEEQTEWKTSCEWHGGHVLHGDLGTRGRFLACPRCR